jgi:MATE family multidrug resistance protein
LAIGVGAGLGLIVLQSVLFWGAFVIAPSSETVESHARTYLQIRIWGAPATIALYALNGWLIALERTRAVLVLQVWQNGFNIGLDVLFVLGLGWGIGGVAAATLIAEWTGLLLGLWLVRAKVRLFWAVAVARIANRAALTAMFQASGDIMARSVLLQLSFTSFVFLGARFGDVTLAANHVLLQFLEIAAFALHGIAFAAESLVGQAVGARSLANLRLATRMSMHWGVGAAIALATLFAVAGYGIIDVMTTSQIVRSEARHYLPWLIAAPVIGVASWIYDGIFIGALMTRAMLRAIVAATLIYAVALCILIPVLGNHGLWAAMMVMLVARAVMMKRALPALYSRMQP